MKTKNDQSEEDRATMAKLVDEIAKEIESDYCRKEQPIYDSFRVRLVVILILIAIAFFVLTLVLIS